MNRKVVVCGVGMVPFRKPGSSESYEVLGAGATKAALADAGLGYQQIEQAYVGYVRGDSCSGQAALYRVGLSTVPIVNVNNSCAAGSTALFLASQAVAHGAVECALALGFEQMPRGAITAQHDDRPDPSQRLLDSMMAIQGLEPQSPIAAQIFGGPGACTCSSTVRVLTPSHASLSKPAATLRTTLTLFSELQSLWKRCSPRR